MLLILAAVSISMLAGENGIVKNAQEAKEKTTIEQIKEEIGVAWNGVQTSGIVEGWTIERKASELGSELYIEDKNVTAIESGEDIEVTYKGYNCTLNTITGEVTISNNNQGKGIIKIRNTDLGTLNDTQLQRLYGQTTNFTSVEGVQWQLFYSDTNYIYLIASDYVENEKLPCIGNTIGNITYTATNGLTKSTNSTNSFSTYCANFGADTDSESLLGTTPYSSGSQSSTIIGNPLSQTYLKWATDTTNGFVNSTNANIRAVAFMMDMDKWKSFAGNPDLGGFAIGGPTLEMFVKSYNAVHTGETEQLGEYETLILGTNVTDSGYLLYGEKSDTYGFGTAANSLGSTTDMWCIHENLKANGYWLSAPVLSPTSDKKCLCHVYYDGRVNYVQWGGVGITSKGNATSDNVFGFRPLIAIPKSSLK